MTINTDTVLKDLSGEEIKTDGVKFTLGHALSNMVVGSEEGGKMKLYILGTKLYNGGAVDLDEADFALVKNCVKNTKIYTAIISGQVESILESLSEKHE